MTPVNYEYGVILHEINIKSVWMKVKDTKGI